MITGGEIKMFSTKKRLSLIKELAVFYNFEEISSEKIKSEPEKLWGELEPIKPTTENGQNSKNRLFAIIFD